MSYILDALRKADAEREREQGRVPDLHTQASAAAVPAEGPPARAWPLGWLAAGLAAGVAATALFVWLGGTSQPVGPVAVTPVPAPRSPAPPATVPSSPAGSVPAAAGSPPPAMAAPESAPAALGAVPTASAPAAIRTESKSTAAATPAAATPTPPATPPAGARPSAAPAVAARPTAPEPRAAAKAQSPRPQPAPVPRLSELPEPVRRDLPPIVFGGSMYSEQRSARMVVLNGRVFREGETIIPGLVLEEVRPRSAVLRYRDQRFSLP